MSKNKKYRNFSQNVDGTNTDTQNINVELKDTDMLDNDPEITDEIPDDIQEEEIHVLEEPLIEEADDDQPVEELNETEVSVELETQEQHHEIVSEVHDECKNTISEELDPAPEVQPTIEKPITLYKVGTGWATDKCLNQISTTSDLQRAIDTCNCYRDTYKKSCYIFDEKGNAVYTAEYNIPKDNYYRVGTDWKNGLCINQKYTCVNFDEACENANNNTKQYGLIYNVYDPSGKVVFSAKKKLTLLSYKKRSVNKNASWYTK